MSVNNQNTAMGATNSITPGHNAAAGTGQQDGLGQSTFRSVQ